MTKLRFNEFDHLRLVQIGQIYLKFDQPVVRIKSLGLKHDDPNSIILKLKQNYRKNSCKQTNIESSLVPTIGSKVPKDRHIIYIIA